MVNHYLEKVKEFFVNYKSDLYIASIIFFVGMASFGLGRLSIVWPKKEPIAIESYLETDLPEAPIKKEGEEKSTMPQSRTTQAAGRYVASKSGSYYHLPWCPGARRIKDSNKIWFQDKKEAEARGLKPAGNCEGL